MREAFFAKQGWYPENREQLSKMLENAFSKADRNTEKTAGMKPEQIKGIISPHAGYVFCLETAAHAWVHLTGRKTGRVFLLGPSHRAYADRAVLAGFDSLSTPLGSLETDQSVNKQLLQNFPELFMTDNRIHTAEHSLEMQLPLIYKTLGKVRIVPVIMPQAEPEALQQIGNAIASVLEPEDLIVISTDLSHFPPRKIATEVDQDAMNSWLTLNPEVIFQTEEKWQKSQKTSTAMCGVAAIVTGISALNKAFNSENLQTLNMHYSDSGTASGDTGRVVGYGSALIVHKTTNLPEKEKADKNKERNAPEPTENKMFNADTRKEMLLIARKTLEQHLSGQKVKIENPGLPELEKNGYGIFVTMKNKGMLRGCIGIFSSEKPLWKLISEFAIASSQDQRFYNNPVTEKELPEIDFEISVLSPLRQIKSYQEAIIGTHGIVIERGWNRGVFLPQVATETGWNLEEFWAHLTRDKAGLPVTLYREPDAQTKLYIFDAEVFGEKAH